MTHRWQGKQRQGRCTTCGVNRSTAQRFPGTCTLGHERFERQILIDVRRKLENFPRSMEAEQIRALMGWKS
jgi:hypothetical protein